LPLVISGRDDAGVLDAVDADAIEDLVGGLEPEQLARLGASVQRVGPALALVCQRLTSPVFNRVLALGSVSAATTDDLAVILATYRRAPAWSVIVADPASPPALTSWLENAGLVPVARTAKLWHPMDVVPGRVGTIVVRRTDDADLVANVLTEAHGSAPELRDWWAAPVGRPGWQHFAAWRDDRVVAVGALRIAEQMAWLGFAGALPEARRLGAQSALIAHRIRAAADAGCRVAVAETADDLADQPDAALRNLLRLGFVVAYRRTCWESAAPA
jgi:GNAT superfamily N-acetyltransferase